MSLATVPTSIPAATASVAKQCRRSYKRMRLDISEFSNAFAQDVTDLLVSEAGCLADYQPRHVTSTERMRQELSAQYVQLNRKI